MATKVTDGAGEIGSVKPFNGNGCEGHKRKGKEMSQLTAVLPANRGMRNDSQVVRQARRRVETLKTRAKFVGEKLAAGGYSIGAANYMRRELAALVWSIRFIEFAVRSRKRAIAERKAAKAAGTVSDVIPTF